MDALPFVIVGGGQSGAWAAKTLRDEGFAGRIVLISEEHHLPYERPPLSKAVLAGVSPPETTRLFKDAVWNALRLEWQPGRRAASLDRTAQVLRLEDGTSLRYDKLLLATGGRARELVTDTPSSAPVQVLRTLDDAKALCRQLSECRRVLIAGAGWIGLEVAATARKLGVDVHVIESQDRICARALPASVADRLLALHRGHGVQFSLRTRIVRLEAGGPWPIHAHLDNGEEVDADCVVAGLGLLANDSLAQEAGLECANGIVVDDRCATADAHVFAAGDVTLTPNRWVGERTRLESWQNAQDQGIAAAHSMLGRDLSYDPLPRFWSDQYDVNIQIAGAPQVAHRIVFRESSNSSSFIAFVLDDNCIRAAIGFNAGRDMRIARGLVERAARVIPARLVDAGVDLKAVEAGTE